MSGVRPSVCLGEAVWGRPSVWGEAVYVWGEAVCGRPSMSG